MAYRQSGIRKHVELRYAAGIWAVAFLLGTLGARFGANYYQDGMKTLENYFQTIIRADWNYGALLWHVLVRNTGGFVIFFMAQITIFGIPVMAYALLASGAALGFFGGAVCGNYGGMGLLITAASILPQAFVYVPAAARCISVGYRLNRASGSGKNIPGIHTLWSDGYIKEMAAAYGIMLIGCAAECFAGFTLLRKVLEFWNG